MTSNTEDIIPDDENLPESSPQPEFETPMEESGTYDQSPAESAPSDDFPEGQIPSFPVDSSFGVPVFDFSPIPSDEIEFMSPSRLGDDEPIRLPGNRRRRRQN